MNIRFFGNPGSGEGSSSGSWKKRIVYAGLGLGALAGASSFVYTVESDENAVITTFGDVARVKGSGLGFKKPWEAATKYSVGALDISVIQTRPSCNTTANQDTGNTTYTKDQQFIYASAFAQISLQSGDALGGVHRKYQNYQSIATNYLNQAMKAVLGSYNTVDIPQARQEISDKIREALVRQIEATRIDGVPFTINVSQVQFKNFDFSCKYEASVETAAQAKTDLTRRETELQTARIAKDILVVQAEATRAQAELQGQGDASIILAKAEAEAKGIALMQQALAQSPMLVEFEKAKRWNGALPTNYFAGAPLPFFNATTALAGGSPAAVLAPR